MLARRRSRARADRLNPRTSVEPVSELRFNELRGEEVVYSAERQDRTLHPPEEECPLCPGGGEVPDGTFDVAVFENRWPLFSHPDGAAEVVVYSDRHEGSFGTLPEERARLLARLWRERYGELGARSDVEYVLIFENRGSEVGATLHHPHGQIYGYPFLPPVPAAERRADARRGGCTVCGLLERELSEEERVVAQNEAAIAFVPFASRWPFELHVALERHRESLVDCPDSELDGLLDSGARHELAAGRGYNERRAECERARELLAAGTSLPLPLAARMRHVKRENGRVDAMCAALEAGDLAEAGHLLDASHASLRDDFEVSVPEVERTVELAKNAGALGARIHGGGFGGGVLALFRPGADPPPGSLDVAPAAGARLLPAPPPRGGPN